jgi:hypothetical protein
MVAGRKKSVTQLRGNVKTDGRMNRPPVFQNVRKKHAAEKKKAGVEQRVILEQS